MISNLGKILVVDDIETNRFFAEELLEELGYEVFLAKSAEQGMELTKSHNPDVILLDIMMEGMDGFEMCKLIKKDNQLKDIKVIFVSAKDQLEDKIKGLVDFGADDYLTKPFDQEELAARVEAQLRTKKNNDILKQTLSKAEHMAVIGNMAASVAHDFNNVLANMQVFYFLRKYLEDIKSIVDCKDSKEFIWLCDKMENYFTMGETGLALGTKIVHGLVTFVQGTGNVRSKQPVSPIIRAPFKILERKLKNEGIAVDFLIEDEGIEVYCNDGEIQQVVLNLAVNAIYSMKSSIEKKLKIKVWTAGEKVAFSITDTGEGIPPEVMPKIYESLFTTKPHGKGTGIGLSAVKKIIEAHNGTIKVDSNPGCGTTFTVFLPFE